MTEQPRELLAADKMRRVERLGTPRPYWTATQQALFDSPYALTVAWGANGVGKSEAIAELARRAIAGQLNWQRPGPRTVMLLGNTWKQLGQTLKYLFAGLDKSWVRPRIRYEAGGIKGQRIAIFDIMGGPGKGGELWCGTFDAENSAGPRAEVVITDEPLPESVFNELWPRLLGRNGRMYQTFTPTLGTAHKLDYLWKLVDDPTKPWAGEIRTPLTLEAVTPVGSRFPIPWMTQEEIDRFEAGLSAVQVDMRMGRVRTPRVDTAYFGCWGPHLVTADTPPGGTRLGIGIDHGSRPGAQRAVLAAVGGRGIYARAWVLDEYKGDGRTESEDDARGILSMLERQGYALKDIDLWVGDRAHHGDRRGGAKSNTRLQMSIAQAMGVDVTRRGWAAHLPEPLRRMQTPRKYDRSVWEGVEILHRMMVGQAGKPMLTLSPRCTALAYDFATWQGAKLDPCKDGIDACRYVVVPMAEGDVR